MSPQNSPVEDFHAEFDVTLALPVSLTTHDELSVMIPLPIVVPAHLFDEEDDDDFLEPPNDLSIAPAPVVGAVNAVRVDRYIPNTHQLLFRPSIHFLFVLHENVGHAVMRQRHLDNNYHSLFDSGVIVTYPSVFPRLDGVDIQVRRSLVTSPHLELVSSEYLAFIARVPVSGIAPNCYFSLFRRRDDEIVVDLHVTSMFRRAYDQYYQDPLPLAPVLGAPCWIYQLVKRWFDCVGVRIDPNFPGANGRVELSGSSVALNRFIEDGPVEVDPVINRWHDGVSITRFNGVFTFPESDFNRPQWFEMLWDFVAFVPYYLLRPDSPNYVAVQLPHVFRVQLARYLMSVESRALPMGAICDLFSLLCEGRIYLFGNRRYWDYWLANCASCPFSIHRDEANYSYGYQPFVYSSVCYSYR